MSKFNDYWELQETFTTNKELSDFLLLNFHWRTLIHTITIEENDYDFHLYLLVHLDHTFNFAEAHEKYKTHNDSRRRVFRSDADIYWEYYDVLYSTLEEVLMRSKTYDDCHRTMIVTSKQGHHVFRRKLDQSLLVNHN